MLDLHPNGDVGIDFESEDGTVTQVVVHPPRVGAYRRLRKQLSATDAAREKFRAGLDESIPDVEKRNLEVEFHEDALLDWWALVLIGDESFAPLTTDAVPSDRELWPLQLASTLAAVQTVSHWVAAPLHSTDRPEPETSETQPQPDL